MMKRFYLSLIALIQTALLLGHGFSADTLVLLANNAWQEINSVCYRTQKKNVHVASYDTSACYHTTSKTIRGGKSRSNCFISFAVADELPTSLCELRRTSRDNNVVCTPTQEFYSATTHQWIPAYKLKIGDELRCAHNVIKKVTHISLIKESLDIFTIEVQHTHTFFVTQHALLTHNMVMPVAFSLGFSIPFGAAGGTAGGFFGPITFVAGIALGCAVGALVKIACNSKMPTYTIDAYNPNAFEQYVKQQPQIATFSEPQITYSPDYVATQENAQQQSESLRAGAVHAYHDDNNEMLFSTTIVNLPKEKPGCGDTTPQKPLILITPADPMPVFQCPGYSPPREEDRCKGPHTGCGDIPDELKDLFHKPLILIEDNNPDDRIDKVLEGALYINTTNEKTKIYHKPKTYDDAVKDFDSMKLDNKKSMQNDEGFVGSLPDGRFVNVRKASKGNHKGEEKWPTLEIRSINGKRSKLKIRYTKEK